MGVGAVIGAVIGGATFAAGSTFFGASMAASVVTGAAVGYSLSNRGRADVGNYSPTYSFDEFKNTADEHLPVPIVYGRVRVAGNIIHHRIENEGKYLYMAVGLSEGPIDAIEEVYVNDEPIEGIKDAQWSFQLGTADQGPDDKVGTGERFKHTAYLALRFKANDQVSSTPHVSAVIRGLKVPVWNGSGWVTQYSNNPAYCVLDLLRNTRYGLGIPDNRIDLDSFIEEAAYCDELVDGEKRFELDYAIDFQRSSLDTLDDILATFRAFLIYSEGKIRLQINRSRPVVYAFNMDNIVANSFEYSKISYKETPNQVKVEWIDPDAGWERVETVYDNEFDQDRRGEVYSRTVSLLGITRPGQAGRMARFYHDQSYFCTTICSFRVGIDALGCEVGDVISVSHDVPGWDQKLFRVLEITEDENDEMTLRCIEYVSAIYHDRGSVYQPSKQGTLPSPLRPPMHVTNVALEPATKTLGDGTAVTSLKVTWTEPDDINYFRARIYWTKSGDAEWTFAGTSEIPVFEIPLVDPGTYTVLVQSESHHRVRAPFETAPTATITVSSVIPPDVTGVTTDFTGPDLVVTWNPVGGSARYRVRILGPGSQVVRTVHTSATEYRYSYEANVADFGGWGSPTVQVSVEAQNDYGNYSANPTVVTATNPPPAKPVVTGDSSLSLVRWTIQSAIPSDFRHVVVSVGTYSETMAATSGVVSLRDAGIGDGDDQTVTVRVVDLFGQESEGGTVQITGRYLTSEDLQGALFAITPSSTPAPQAGDLESLWDMDTSTGVTFPGGPVSITFAYPVEQGSDMVRVHLDESASGWVQMKRAEGDWIDVLGSEATPINFTAGWNVHRFAGNRLYFGKEYRLNLINAVKVNELKFWRVTLADEVLAQTLKLTGDMKIENENGSVVIDSTSIKIFGEPPVTEDTVDSAIAGVTSQITGVANEITSLANGERVTGTFINGRSIISPALIASSNSPNYTVVTEDGLQFVRGEHVTRYFSGVQIGEAEDISTGGNSVELDGFVRPPRIVLMPIDLVVHDGKRVELKPVNVREEDGVWKFDVHCRTYTLGTLFSPYVNTQVRVGESWVSPQTDPNGTTNRIGVKMKAQFRTTVGGGWSAGPCRFDFSWRVVRKNLITNQEITHSGATSESFGSRLLGHSNKLNTVDINERAWDVPSGNWQLSVYLDSFTKTNGNWTVHDAWILVEYWRYSSDTIHEIGRAQYVAFDGG